MLLVGIAVGANKGDNNVGARVGDPVVFGMEVGPTFVGVGVPNSS